METMSLPISGHSDQYLNQVTLVLELHYDNRMKL